MWRFLLKEESNNSRKLQHPTFKKEAKWKRPKITTYQYTQYQKTSAALSDPGGKYLRIKSFFSGEHTTGVRADGGQEELKKNKLQNFGEIRAELDLWVGEVDD